MQRSDRTARRRPRLARCLTTAVLVAALAVPATAHAGATEGGVRGSAEAKAQGELLRPTVGLYPRLVRLGHSGAANGRIIASVVTFDGDNGLGAIYQSTDEGASFDQIGTVADPASAGGKGLCCASIYELPRQVGDMPAGTLLWASSAGQDSGPDRRMSIRIWRSDDDGRTWSLLATPATAANNKGMWEPELLVSADGRLVVVWADETDQPAHSQMLVQSVSSDGATWSPRTPVVASTDPSARPGMPVVRRLPNGTYLMTYEVCGGGEGCSVHYRTSADGVQWGDPAALGPRITASDGTYFTHTPNTALGAGTTEAGRLYLVGQILTNPDGTPAEGNGRTVMVSDNGPAGPWTRMPAPVTVPDPYDDYCPNYSSALLPVHDDGQLLEIATDYADDGVCKAYYGTGPAG